MENQNHKIDEIFRQRLHDAEVPPPPFVWPAVELGLQKRRRRFVFLWMFVFGIVAACVGTWQISLWNHSTPTTVITPTADNQTNEPTTSVSEQQENAHDVSATTAVENSANTGKVPLSTGTSGQRGSDRLTKFASKGEDSSMLQKSTGFQHGITPVPVLTDFTSSEKDVLPISTQSLQISPPELISSLTDKKKTVSLKTFTPPSRGKKAKPRLCYDFTRHPNAWLLDIYGGPSFAQRSLTSRLEDEPYLNQRLATERRSVAMNAGIRASLMFNRNLLVRTGLNYDQVTEVFEYIDPTTVIYRLQFTPGNPIPDTLGVEYGENYLKTYNRYAMLDIPLMVGAEMRQGRTGFSVNAGISANVLFQKRGVIIDPITHEPARFGHIPNDPTAAGPKTSVSQDVFRANVGLSAVASIQWYWHISPHLRLFAEPSFRQVLRPVTLSSHPVEQRYSIIGLRLGATKIF